MSGVATELPGSVVEAVTEGEAVARQAIEVQVAVRGASRGRGVSPLEAPSES